MGKKINFLKLEVIEASNTRVIIGDKSAVCLLEIAKDQKPPEVGKEVRLSKPIKLDNDHICVKNKPMQRENGGVNRLEWRPSAQKQL